MIDFLKDYKGGLGVVLREWVSQLSSRDHCQAQCHQEPSGEEHHIGANPVEHQPKWSVAEDLLGRHACQIRYISWDNDV